MRPMMLWAGVAAAVFSAGCSVPDGALLSAAMERYSISNAPLVASAGQAGVRSDALQDHPSWPARSVILAQRAEPAPPGQAEKKPFTPWRQRRGPAYPGDFWHSLGRDAKEMPLALLDDAKATVTNPVSLIGIGLAGASGIALCASDADDKVAGHYTRHGSQLNGFWDTVADVGGNPGTHFALAGAMYVASLARQDAKNYEVSKTLVNALAINGIYTMALKGIVRTRSPNGDPLGWPSGHTSSTFCLATVMYEAYGPVVGVPLLAFATYVGYERVDARNHDFSDVISGALLGIAVGHAVAKNHQMKIFGMDVVPYVTPDAAGIALMKRW